MSGKDRFHIKLRLSSAVRNYDVLPYDTYPLKGKSKFYVLDPGPVVAALAAACPR